MLTLKPFIAGLEKTNTPYTIFPYMFPPSIQFQTKTGKYIDATFKNNEADSTILDSYIKSSKDSRKKDYSFRPNIIITSIERITEKGQYELKEIFSEHFKDANNKVQKIVREHWNTKRNVEAPYRIDTINLNIERH